MENNSKQAVLSIVGIAVLVIAVVGVSFAFFTYSKQGTTNNVITTGSIAFEFKEATNGLTLTNQFPQADVDGKENDTFTFSVTGKLPTSMSPISYTVYAIPGDAMEGKTRLKNSEINFYVTKTAGDDNATVVGGYDTATATEYGAVVTDAIDGGSATAGTGLQIASGTIEASGLDVTDSYSMTMWVNDSVTISDTDTTKTYRASATDAGADTRAVYNTLYYSFKVRVDAQG